MSTTTETRLKRSEFEIRLTATERSQGHRNRKRENKPQREAKGKKQMLLGVNRVLLDYTHGVGETRKDISEMIDSYAKHES